MKEIHDILRGLATRRPLFHSEADFQHALAWQIHQESPNAKVRLELPVQVGNSGLHIDIWIEDQDTITAIELKYKTRSLLVQSGSEHFRLKNQSAQDIGRYDFLKDIQRLEQVATARRKFTGYAVLLTNDNTYWAKPAKPDTVDANFRIYDGRILEGSLEWGINAAAGTKENREQPLVLKSRYIVEWQDYSQSSPSTYGTFRFLVIRVS